MRRAVVVFGLAVLLALAGCTLPTTPGGDGSAADVGPSAGQSGDGGDARTMTVAVRLPPDAPADLQSSARSAVNYWDEHVDAIAGVDRLRFEPTASSPDVVIAYSPTVTTCNGEQSDGTYLYCSRPTDDDQNRGRLTVASRFVPGQTETLTRIGLGGLLRADETAIPDSPTPLQNRDPWPEHGPVVVGVENSANTDRDLTPLVERAVGYWNGIDAKNWSAPLVVRPDATDPDVTVRLVEEIETCGVESGTDVLGCAPVLDATAVVEGTETVRIEAGYTDASTVRVIKHELGHLHGRRHGQEPMPLMSVDYRAVKPPTPDAASRTYPFGTATLSVYVDHESISASTTSVDSQVRHALTYYSSGAEGHAPDDLSVGLTDDRSEADVLVTGGDDDRGSKAAVYGTSVDSDEALETYDRLEITISGLAADRIGWHVGYWLGRYATDATGRSDLPPPFDDPADPREEWW